jgi:hypothetical protein
MVSYHPFNDQKHKSETYGQNRFANLTGSPFAQFHRTFSSNPKSNFEENPPNGVPFGALATGAADDAGAFGGATPAGGGTVGNPPVGAAPFGTPFANPPNDSPPLGPPNIAPATICLYALSPTFLASPRPKRITMLP